MNNKNALKERRLQYGLSYLCIKFELHKNVEGKKPDIFIEPNIHIFVEGYQWHHTLKQRMKDDRINKHLMEKGIKVERLSEHDITHNLRSCMQTIISMVPQTDRARYHKMLREPGLRRYFNELHVLKALIRIDKKELYQTSILRLMTMANPNEIFHLPSSLSSSLPIQSLQSRP